MVEKHAWLVMNILRIPHHQSPLSCDAIYLMSDVHLETKHIRPTFTEVFQYSAQLRMTPKQAQLSMLITHHHLMVKYDANPILSITAS